jgi:hypothetical protein
LLALQLKDRESLDFAQAAKVRQRGEDMKKEMLKGFTMLMLIVALALATAAVSVNAQSRNEVRSSIPFEFVVGDKALPVGEYNLRMITRDALMIQGSENGQSAIRLSASTEKSKKSTHTRLVFHCYGQRYFLAQVWDGGTVGLDVAKSRQERAIQRESDLAQSMYKIIEVVAVLR